MQYFLLFAVISTTVHLSVAPPVNQKTKNGEDDKENQVADKDDMSYYMEYSRYLMEVVQALESDPEFRAKLEKADEADIRTGKIAEELQFVNHNLRTRLDELKREELKRLRHLATKENEIKNGLDIDYPKIAGHLDHTNSRTFEIQDLKNLIAKTAKDLAEVDSTRRDEFKYHEMQKKFEEQEKLKNMNDEEKKKYEQELESLKEKQKHHDPVHHPGSKQQLEEVWEKQDHMEGEDFNPRTFFFMHDVDGNGVWDQDEVKVLFLKELDKLYAHGEPQEDFLKRTEEMERMREHVFYESDLNKDGLISYEEFLEQTKKPDFQEDEGWQSLDGQQIYTQREYEEFQRVKQLQVQEMLAKGMLQQHPGNVPDQQKPFPPQYAHAPVAPGAVPPQEYGDSRNPNLQHPGQFQDQIHPQYHQQVPQQEYPNRMPAQPIHGQVPQQQQQYHPQVQQHPGQVAQNQQYQQLPVQQLHPGQVPVQQLHPGQVPVQQHQEKVPIQHQQQIPIQQQQGHVPAQQNQPETLNVQQQNVVKTEKGNDVPQQKNPNQVDSQAAQAPVQQDVNRNKIQSGEKA